MLATALESIARNVALKWTRYVGATSATGRIFVITIGTFLVVAVVTSSIDSARDHDARELLAAGNTLQTDGFRFVTAAGEPFAGNPKADSEFRFVLMGASETARLSPSTSDESCSTLILCLQQKLDMHVATKVNGLHLQAAGSGRYGRLSALAWLIQADLDIDLLIVTYSLHGIAAESREVPSAAARNESSKERTSRSKLSLPVRALNAAPLTFTDRILGTLFFSYETRFKYSIAQWIPFGTTPLVYRTDAKPDRDSPNSTRRDVRTMDIAEAQEFAANIADTLGSAHAQDGRLVDSMSALREIAATDKIPTLVVFTPIDDTHFTVDDWQVVEAYKAQAIQAADETLRADRFSYVDALAAYSESPEWFLDPAHLTHFESLSSLIVEHLAKIRWLSEETED